MNTTHRAQATSPLAHKATALLLSLLLCIGILPGVAWAAPAHVEQQPSQSSQAGTATLTIVQGVSSFDGSAANVVVNKKYAFAAGATLSDLLAAAKAAGDIEDYVFTESSYGGSYLTSVTPKGGEAVDQGAVGSMSYWAVYKDGAYGSGDTGKDIDALADGTQYQFAWTDSVTNEAPSSWEVSDKADASGVAAGAKSATLTIVNGNDWQGAVCAVNKKYAFAEEATLGDLFAAAKAAGDIKDYVFGTNEYLLSITLKDGTVMANPEDFSSYWASFENGGYAGDEGVSPDAGKVSEKLVDGVQCQFAWTAMTVNRAPGSLVALDWSVSDKATDGSGVAGDAGKDEPTQPEKQPVVVDAQTYSNLFSNIAASFANTSDEWQAMDLAAIGQASTVDRTALTALVLASKSNPGATNLQRGILAATAVGDIVTARDLVASLASSSSSTATLNGKFFALLSYASGPYGVSSDALVTPTMLVDSILASQHTDGGFSLSGASDSDMTAMAIAALAPLRSEDARIDQAVQSALTALQSMQRVDGGFASEAVDGAQAASNPNSTAFAVIALCAAGIDPASSWVTESGQTPLTALLSFSNAERNGFLYKGASNASATEQGFRALISYQGLKNTGAAYNIYTQAKQGQAGMVGIDADDTSVAGSAAVLAKTSDNTAPLTVVVLSLAMLSLASLVALRRRAALCERRAA